MLNIHSQFSMRYGILSSVQILQEAQSLGYPDIFLTDINSSSAVLGYVRECLETGIVPRAGIDFRNGITQQFVGLARNNDGYNELNIFLSTHLHDGTDFPDRSPAFSHCHVVYPWGKAPRKLLEHEWIGVNTRDLNRVRIKASAEELSKMVILQPMTFRHQKDFNAHRLLRCIAGNCLLSMLGKDQQADAGDLFIPREELYRAFADFPGIIANTDLLLADCALHFDFGEAALPQNIATYTGNRAEDLKLLRALAQEGIPYRYKNPAPEVMARIEKEIEVIERKNYISYFLVTWDIVSYAHSKNYFYVGRGSGANSILAYLLRITDVDPLELDLYFERFINLFRKNPPDFDMDFSWKDRADVTRYIFERFPSAALLCTYHTFQYRASVRELAKVLGLPAEETDRLASGEFNPGELDTLSKLVIKYSRYIDGLPSHLSIHAGGILISEKPVTCYSATFMPPKGYRTVQFSMLEAEDVGLYKFDILSQRGLAKIHDCLQIAAYNQPENPPHDIHDLAAFKEDKGIKDMLRSGKALGCFYVESPAMRMLLLKLGVDDYLTLVAASSIIRPGVAQSGMMNQYIRRHLDPVEREAVNPIMYSIMPDTYGVMVYQEDVIKVAHEFAGLTLAEADILRRGMSGKFRARQEFQRVKDQFFSNCLEKGHTSELTAEIWRQIESFAGYSFSKGHSASYAVESYQTLYLKCYYPLEYMVATLNNGGGFYSPEMYVHEARLCGATIESPSVNYGAYENIICGQTIYLGFMMLDGIEIKCITGILTERQANGRYVDFDDLMRRVPVPFEQLRILIKSGALRDLNSCKKSLLWQARFYLNKPYNTTPCLFDTPVVKYDLPPLEEHPLETAFSEMELLGFPLSSPFGLLAEPYRPEHYILAEDISLYQGKIIEAMGYLVATKKTKTMKGEAMYFGTFLDIAGKQFDTVHFPQTASRHRFRGKGIYRIQGKVTEEFSFYTIEVTSMYKCALMEDVRFFDAG